jgi:hypothetical protein
MTGRITIGVVEASQSARVASEGSRQDAPNRVADAMRKVGRNDADVKRSPQAAQRKGDKQVC